MAAHVGWNYTACLGIVVVACAASALAQPFDLVRIGLTDAEHTDPSTGYRYSWFETYAEPAALTGGSIQSGVGSAGRSAWVFDPRTAETIRVGFTDGEHTAGSGLRKSVVVHPWNRNAPGIA